MWVNDGSVIDTSVYTVGSPAINNGVATGLTSSDYIVTAHSIDFSKEFEFVLDFTLPSYISGRFLRMFYASGTDLFNGYITSQYKLELALPTGGWIYTSDSLTLGASYKAKYVYDGTDISVYLDSGIGYELVGTQATTWDTVAPLTVTSADYYNGSINLNNSYITTEGTTINLSNVTIQ